MSCEHNLMHGQLKNHVCDLTQKTVINLFEVNQQVLHHAKQLLRLLVAKDHSMMH